VKQAAATAFVLLLSAAAAPASLAQVSGAPQPIPVPPIPAPPQIGAQPKITLPAIRPPPDHPVVGIPDAPELDRVIIPPEAAITPADKTDPVPPPRSGTQTAAPPVVSPGAATANIQEVFYIVDPGVTQVAGPAENKLKDIAKDMAQDPAARLEVRTYTPAKVHSEGTARRVSLSRFLAIRDFLIQNGVGDDRIDGRPLTSEPNELNADRVELYIER